MENINQNDIRYQHAKRRVKRIKGFYFHAIVYFIVNFMILFGGWHRHGNVFNVTENENYWTAIWWGIGLVIHGLSVFLPNFIFGSNWEERKTQELMEKYKKEQL